MKTGGVHDPGGRAAPYLVIDGWTPWLYHAPEEELEPYYRAANALMAKLEQMPSPVRGRLERVEIRCPVKGCLLATVYWIPRRLTDEELDEHRRRPEMGGGMNGARVRFQFPRTGSYLYVGRTAGGTEVYDILFYGFSSTHRDEARGCTCCRMVYWRAGCRHGTASLERNAMHEMFSLARRQRHLTETEEEAVASLPEPLRPFWGKRVFHPDPAAWHPKRRQHDGGRHNPGNHR
jgi:hypothetical protein